MDVERANIIFIISFLLLVFWTVLSWLLLKGTKNRHGKGGSRIWSRVIEYHRVYFFFKRVLATTPGGIILVSAG